MTKIWLKQEKKPQQYLTSLKAEHWTSNLIIGTILLLFLSLKLFCIVPLPWLLDGLKGRSWVPLRHMAFICGADRQIVHGTQFCKVWQLLCITEISFPQKSVEFESSNSYLTLVCFHRKIMSDCEKESSVLDVEVSIKASCLAFFSPHTRKSSHNVVCSAHYKINQNMFMFQLKLTSTQCPLVRGELCGRGTSVVFVDVEDHLVDRTVSHWPIAADLVANRGKKGISFTVEVTVLFNKHDIYFALVRSHVKAQAKMYVNLFL